ncbi:head-tail connector protein [Pasteurella bettyae]|uniref:Phage gp6-like head-tail connector protein n=1 Tax=Pasteurella bettyae CCUG 2042 TaxID=1095749 RepID=I3DCE2_9PAST|nr:head-tail connector protein [Pasteurella bettyae]EIJ69385.1 Phage gp6-like head-tail connector protein [Pasteurella bettyae CCUG 2042]SUB21414.1 uncharacterized phage protein (possible DNA packaging) [Pasteurella bettyae]
MLISNLIELGEVKAQLSIDHNLDDTLLNGYIVAAIEVAQKHIGKTFGDSDTEKTIVFNQAIKVGCLMYIAYLYANREAVTDLANLKPAPMTISALWEVYREPCVY